MTDATAKPSLTKAATPQRSAGSKSVETDKLSAAARADHKPAAMNTPTRPSSALNARQTNSTPRPRPRPAPLRSTSMPLARSMSVRVSKKDRRWSVRLPDPKSPVSTTYKDDYRSPEELSYKLDGLNLETPRGPSADGSDGDPNSSTTYRQSFQWPPKGRADAASTLSSPARRGSDEQKKGARDAGDTFRSGGADTASGDKDISSAGRETAASLSSSRTVAANSDVPHRVGQSRNRSDRLSMLHSPPAETSTRRPVFKNIFSVPKKVSDYHNSDVLNSRTSLVFSEESASSTSTREQNLVSTKPANGKEAVPKPANGKEAVPIPANGNGVPVKENGPLSPGIEKPSRLVNGVASPRVSSSASAEHRLTPRRSRAYQLQSSSSDGSPFVYGSDSGT